MRAGLLTILTRCVSPAVSRQQRSCSDFSPILLILIAPVIGWRIGCLLRSPVAAGRQNPMSPGLLVVTLPFAPFAFICLEGVFRAAFLAFLGLLVLFAHISAKRVAT